MVFPSRVFHDASRFPLLVPILVGALDAAAERRYGAILAPYLADETSIFIASSDFCHWGLRFRYTYYVPSSSSPLNLRSGARRPQDPPIHKSIANVDQICMDAVESGRHEEFLRRLRETKNTVCGQHPIGVVMAAVEALSNEGKIGEGKGAFKFIRYERSSDVVDVNDSSVSYCSAFAII
jgi:MEMO1 family protein